jgi:hypothetical protein
VIEEEEETSPKTINFVKERLSPEWPAISH